MPRMASFSKKKKKKKKKKRAKTWNFPKLIPFYSDILTLLVNMSQVCDSIFAKSLHQKHYNPSQNI